jgi:hypothetical protein
MGEELQHEVTQILHDWGGGDLRDFIRPAERVGLKRNGASEQRDYQQKHSLHLRDPAKRIGRGTYSPPD